MSEINYMKEITLKPVPFKIKILLKNGVYYMNIFCMCILYVSIYCTSG